METEGVKIYPKPSVLRLIKNKVLQKQYYLENQIPTAEFAVLQSLKEIDQWENLLPAVQKLAEGGYDGRGVQIIDDLSSSHLGFDEHSVLEKKIRIKKEVAAIIAVDQDGKTALYPPVEMVFNKDLNLLDYQIS
ncbi:MAG: ATP-grasp domain-containing protein, partial [Flavisolibacter sp.]